MFRPCRQLRWEPVRLNQSRATPVIGAHALQIAPAVRLRAKIFTKRDPAHFSE